MGFRGLGFRVWVVLVQGLGFRALVKGSYLSGLRV